MFYTPSTRASSRTQYLITFCYYMFYKCIESSAPENQMCVECHKWPNKYITLNSVLLFRNIFVIPITCSLRFDNWWFYRKNVYIDITKQIRLMCAARRDWPKVFYVWTFHRQFVFCSYVLSIQQHQGNVFYSRKMNSYSKLRLTYTYKIMIPIYCLKYF